MNDPCRWQFYIEAADQTSEIEIELANEEAQNILGLTPDDIELKVKISIPKYYENN